jgi:aromatic-L-amino-acid/L-tryptophan decarboxylase
MTLIEVDGKRTFIAEQGGDATATIVLIHGAGMDHGAWTETGRFLAARGRRVVAPDLPGHGGSDGPALGTIEEMAAWLVRLVEELGPATLRLAGHSMGALVALDAAARLGPRVEALALLGFVPEMRVAARLLEEARRDPGAASRRMLRASFADGRPPLFWNLLMTAPRCLAADLAACDAYQGAEDAAWGVICPTLLVLGEQDRLTPPAAARAFANRLANPRLALIPAAGHLMMLEQPETARAAMLTIL